MNHEIHKVIGFERVAPFALRVEFADGATQVIDFRPVLKGELYGALQDPSFFGKVRLDPEAHTFVWPNGADFDPAILHKGPEAGRELEALAKSWTVRARYILTGRG